VVFASFFASAVAYTEIAKRSLLRSFGVDGLKLLRSTLDHYTEPEASGIAELETFFDSMSVRARVRVGGLAFRVGTRLKALFIAPTVHPGPMGYVSGSDLPTKIARDLSDLTSNVMVAHGPTTHDENPATTAEVRKVAEAVRTSTGSATFGAQVGQARRTTYGRAAALAQAFGDVVLIVASFAPQPTDDIDSATGYAAVQEARLQGARDAVFVDAHNCLEPGVGLTLFGSHRSHEIIEAAKSATQAALAAPKAPFRVGYANRKGFSTPDQGIGARGRGLRRGHPRLPDLRAAVRGPLDHDDQLDPRGPSSGLVRHPERRGRGRGPRDGPLLNQVEEAAVDPQVSAQFRMEGRPDEVSLTGEDDSIPVPRQRRAIAPGPQDRGCPDED